MLPGGNVYNKYMMMTNTYTRHLSWDDAIAAVTEIDERGDYITDDVAQTIAAAFMSPPAQHLTALATGAAWDTEDIREEIVREMVALRDQPFSNQDRLALDALRDWVGAKETGAL